ncbi:META domain-containing protein [Phytoactinopolyspora halotolerans]|uniref:META domain-containing protein n=1 Tax=Phytoactinopolyspora halotolerans TaxID=1981512 RepID=A0A6L9S9I8_9ACTN|nr:META domain-containing protein [Phytoactinopolyspora halotolerans]NEE00620.1 META domain-containing protein [Phytoactinopolyspora halotolerans]
MRTARHVAAIGALTVLLMACGDDGGGPVATSDGSGSGADADDVAIDGTWELVEGNGPGGPLEVVDGYPVTLTIGDEVGGRSACNHYGAELTRDGASVSFGVSHMTEMACMPEVMDLESAYFEALEDVRTAGLESDMLVLAGPSSELRFEAVPEVPVAQVVGTDWVLESLVDGVGGDATVSSVAGEPALLRLEEDGTFTGSTGCREMSGDYVVSNGQIAPVELTMDDRECPDELRDQDDHVVSVMEGFQASVDGDTLTLVSQGGRGLVYRTSDG